jgi:2-keto-myo-inositol isomerase
MRLCINGATTMPYSLECDIDMARKYKFDSIELWANKVANYLSENTLEGLNGLLQESGLAVAGIGPYFLRCFDTIANQEAARADFRQGIQAARSLDCTTLLVCPQRPKQPLERSHAMYQLGQELAWFCDAAAAEGLRVALEPLGDHALVATPMDGLELIARVGGDGLGLALDFCHLYHARLGPEIILSLPPERIFIVHVDDFAERDPAHIQILSRVWPTTGAVPVIEMIRAILSIGYSGDLSIEIFQEAYWSMSADDIVRQAAFYLRRCFELASDEDQ